MKSGVEPIADAPAVIVEALQLIETGQWDRALLIYRALVGQKIADPEALHRLGYLATRFGEFERAEACLRAALAAVPDHPWYSNSLGITLRHRRNFAAAIEILRRAIDCVPNQHQLWSNLGNALRDDGRFNEASLAYRQALRLAPDIGYYWSAFGACLRHAPSDLPLDLASSDDLLRAITHPDVSPGDVAPAALRIIKAAPALRRLLEIVGTADGDSKLAAELTDPAVASAFDHPLLLGVLGSTVVADLQMELLLTCVRRCQLLSGVIGGTKLLSLAAVSGIARQCFLNEYAWLETPEETEALRSISFGTADAASDDPMHVAIFAAYRSLGTESARGPMRGPGPAADLFLQQVLEPAEERRLIDAIRVRAPAANRTSEAVREQYESNPYPRWTRIGRFEHALPAPAVLGELFPGRNFSGLPRSRAKVLVAGCGTGRHAIQAALRFADAHVLGFDLSHASLGYAARKTREMGLTNIEYCQGDILEMEGVTGPFDIVESVGVLHHLKDPMAGWRALLQRLAPSGVMRIGLYSERARRHVVAAQKFARSMDTLPSPASIRRLRRAIAESSDAALQRLTQTEDFYTLSGCRDMLLHVQEHRFSPTGLAVMIGALDLEFLGFELADPAIAMRYRTRFPDDAWLTRLENWEEFERGEPDAFFGMYDFWVRRKAAG